MALEYSEDALPRRETFQLKYIRIRIHNEGRENNEADIPAAEPDTVNETGESVEVPKVTALKSDCMIAVISLIGLHVITGLFSENITRWIGSTFCLAIAGFPLEKRYGSKVILVIYIVGFCGGKIMVLFTGNLLFIGLGGAYSIMEAFICDMLSNWVSTSKSYNIFATNFIVLCIILDILSFGCLSGMINRSVSFHCDTTPKFISFIIDLVAGIILGGGTLFAIKWRLHKRRKCDFFRSNN